MSNFDRRRINAPEDSYPPVFPPSAVPEAGPSRDRANDELRPMFIKTGLVTQANGSAYIEAEGVKIACSAFGPRPRPPPYTPHGTLNVQVKFAPFASKNRRAPLRDTEPVSHATVLTNLLLPAVRLHLLPKLSVDVYLHVLEADSDEAVLGAGLSAACAAIADAGIELNGLAVGSTVALQGSSLLLDPTGVEAAASSAAVTVGSLPALGKITNLHMVGEAELDQVCEMVELALQGAKERHGGIAQALIQAESEIKT